MKLRYKTPLRPSAGFALEDLDGTLAEGAILAVRGKVVTVAINFMDLTDDNPLRSGAEPPEDIPDTGYVFGLPTVQS